MVCEIIAELRQKYAIGVPCKTVLISNGSEILKKNVQQKVSKLLPKIMVNYGLK